MTDPIEDDVRELLDLLGIVYVRDGEGGRYGLDFDCGDVFIEAKRAHTDRIAAQTARVDNIIVFQGPKSARLLIEAIRRGAKS